MAVCIRSSVTLSDKPCVYLGGRMLLSSVPGCSNFRGWKRDGKRSQVARNRTRCMSERKDRRLGMGCPITRRDFLNGVAIGAGGLMASDPMLGALLAQETAPEKAPGYYPPALTGMRGNHDGTFTYAHKLRDGKRWDATGRATETGETYDLVVVGGGISGLAAAYFYRKSAGNNVRILVLDNHDDFGGHA